jgi:hypothetical protein
MNKLFITIVSLSIVLAACGQAAPVIPTQTASPIVTTTPLPSDTPTPVPTPPYPVAGLGPTKFPDGVNPLTGLTVANPALLDRRPMVIKISNLPRSVRPQWGLSLADIAFEYYTEEGSTRYAGIFYGKDADIVGPIRSGRLIDANLVRGYKAVFAFGSAYEVEMNRFYGSEYANRLVIETPGSPLTRYDPKGYDYLVVNTADLSAYATKQKMDNVRQNLDGMFFKLEAPAGGQPVPQLTVRYSASIYNRWDYDPTSGRYLRFSDMLDVSGPITNEKYAQLTDRLTNQPVAFDNLVVLYVTHETYSPGIYDILLSGSGDAYAFRDGQAYKVQWQRNDTSVISLTNPDGTPFPFKPGTTFFEVVGVKSKLDQTDQNWRFTHLMP